MSSALLLVGLSSGFQLAARPAASPRIPHVAMVDIYRWSNAKVGAKVDLKEAPSDMAWARAAWAIAADEMPEDGSCYLILDSDMYATTPDPTKEYYFCSAPSSDAKMSCEEMPEWMGTNKDGSTVYICTVPKA